MLQGINEILPDELSKRHDVLEKMVKCFKNNGYNRVTTPTFEPYGEISKGWGKYLKEESIKFISDDGVIMVLRPEMTTPIARLVSARRQELSFPQKFFYFENVFRKKHILRKQEFLQLGAELLGDASIDADVQVVHLLIEVLKSAGIDDFKIEVGHIENCVNENQSIREALLSKEYTKLEKLPELGGSEILAEGSYLKEFDRLFKKTCSKDTKHLIYNLGLAEEVTYYTGIIFNVLLEDVGFIVGSGGRYDNLYKEYSFDMPAVGFAIGFEKLITYFKER
jgi:ATP phosphoribosyltransferase regulatory subunit